MTDNTSPDREHTPLRAGLRCAGVAPRAIALGVASALIVGLAGCGSSGKSSSGSASTTSVGPTKAEYVAKANAICNATNGPLTATALKLAGHPSPAVAEHIISGSFIPEIQSQLHQIQAIGTPTGGLPGLANGRLGGWPASATMNVPDEVTSDPSTENSAGTERSALLIVPPLPCVTASQVQPAPCHSRD